MTKLNQTRLIINNTKIQRAIKISKASALISFTVWMMNHNLPLQFKQARNLYYQGSPKRTPFIMTSEDICNHVRINMQFYNSKTQPSRIHQTFKHTQCSTTFALHIPIFFLWKPPNRAFTITSSNHTTTLYTPINTMRAINIQLNSTLRKKLPTN